MKLISKGFTETPRMSESVISNYPTNTLKAVSVDYKWSHPGGDKDLNLWQNVEFVILNF